MNSKPLHNLLAACAAMAALAVTSRAVEFHVTTAQELQNALTLAAGNGADDAIYLAAGYYTGNFNFNSTENRSLRLEGETGTTSADIAIDGAGTGRSMNLASWGTGDLTVHGLTFLRNCGDPSSAGLRLAASSVSTLWVEACRFLSPTNATAKGLGLEIAWGQNVTLTNCLVIGRGDAGGGVAIVGVSGTVAIGGSTFASNDGYFGGNLRFGGLYTRGASALDVVGNTFNGNRGGGFYGYADGGKPYPRVAFIRNTLSGNGGAVALLSGSACLVTDNIFRDNAGPWGHVQSCLNLYANGGGIVMSNNLFAGNVQDGATADVHPDRNTAESLIATGNSFVGNAGGLTGGIYVVGGSTAIIAGNTFVRNSRPAIYFPAVPVVAVVSNNVFTANAGEYGGALRYLNPGPWGTEASCYVVGNTFNGNRATSGAGGAAYFEFVRGRIVFSGNVFRQNSASQGGGAIHAVGPAVELSNNLLVRNTQTGASYQGGAIYVSPSSTLTMVNNTVTENSTLGSGGGLACRVAGTAEVLDVYNNIIWGNTADGNGADVWLAGTGSRKTFSYNNAHALYGVWDIALNNLDLAPAFSDPVNGDYHLRGTSPCLNVGANDAPSLAAVDLDGNPRVNADVVDLGCYEFNDTFPHPADLNQDWVISIEEYGNYATAWRNDQPWPSGPSQIPADYATRAGFLQNQGGTYHNDGAGAPLCWKPGPQP